MDKIIVEHGPAMERLEELGVEQWPLWTKEISEFRWTYDGREICYFLAGEVEVTPENGAPVRMGKGDLVTFPAGMRCTWKIVSDVRKHYQID